MIADVLQPPEVRQRFVIDAAEAGLLFGLRAGEVPSAGSGDALESDTRKLYINPRDQSLAVSRDSSGSESVLSKRS